MKASEENTDRYKKKWNEGHAIGAQLLTKLHSERTTGKIMGIPQPSIHRLKNRVLSPSGCESAKKTQYQVVKELEEIRGMLLGELRDIKKAKNANDYKALATSMGIVTDKIAALSGEPTHILGIVGLMERPDNELAKILEGDVEVTDAELELDATLTSDNKHNVSLSQEEGHKGPKISNSEADEIE